MLKTLTEIATHELDTAYGRFNLAGYLFGDNQQIVFAMWHPSTHSEPMVRIQYGCINGTVFKATDCDCGAQIDAALRKIASNKAGIFIYFPDHEALGLGLIAKMRLVAEEKKTRKTFSEVLASLNIQPGNFDVMWVVPHIFDRLSIGKTIILLGRNGAKISRLEELGFTIARVLDLET
jgi:GTP cyclohydrolase II